MNRIFTRIALPTLLWLLPHVCLCSQETILEPQEISIRTDAGAPFGEVNVVVRAKGQGPERRISNMQLRVGNKSVHVPAKAYDDLASPLLNTVELRTESGYDKDPWLYIFFQTGHRSLDGQWRPKRVRIACHAGRIESRSIGTPLPDGSYKWKEEKL